MSRGLLFAKERTPLCVCFLSSPHRLPSIPFPPPPPRTSVYHLTTSSSSAAACCSAARRSSVVIPSPPMFSWQTSQSPTTTAALVLLCGGRPRSSTRNISTSISDDFLYEIAEGKTQLEEGMKVDEPLLQISEYKTIRPTGRQRSESNVVSPPAYWLLRRHLLYRTSTSGSSG